MLSKNKIKENFSKNKFAWCVSISFIALVLFFVIFYINFVIHKNIYIFSSSGINYGKLKPLNSYSKSAKSKNSESIYYKFNSEQLKLIENEFFEAGTVSLVVRLSVKFPEGQKLYEYEELGELPFSFGFLDDDDFSKKDNFQFSEKNRLCVNADFSELINSEQFTKTFDVSFSFPINLQTGNIENKRGFFINSFVPINLQSACIAPVMIGYDKSSEVQFWGFPPNGGKISFALNSFDFTGSSLIFPQSCSKNIAPPEFSFNLHLDDDNKNFTFSFGGEKLKIKRTEKITVQSMALKNPFSNMEISEGKSNVLSVILKNGDNKIIPEKNDYVTTPIKVDPGLITSWPQSSWRNVNYELFEWDRFPHILFFDTKNYAVQSKFFARLAFFVEKAGFKGRILSDFELQGKHDFNAHDYSAESLAKFFNEAYRLDFPLNNEEQILLKILLENDILEEVSESGAKYKSNGGAVLSISREIPSWNRVSLLAHEGWHTLFFTDDEFRNFVAAVYSTMDYNSREFLLDYFRSQPSLGYDTNDEYLMHNEFMAYILQQSVDKTANYFLTRASWNSVMNFTPNLCNYIKNTQAYAFEDCAIILNDYVSDRYNLVAGNLGLCSY